MSVGKEGTGIKSHGAAVEGEEVRNCRHALSREHAAACPWVVRLSCPFETIAVLLCELLSVDPMLSAL